MASIMSGTVSTLLKKLGDLLMDECKLQKSVRGEIMFLKAEFESMQAALLKVSEAPIDQQPDNQVMLWARQVRELSYDVEDRVDKFMVRIEREPKELHGLRGFIDRSLDLLTKAKIRHKLGTEIKDLKKTIREVSERRDRYMVNQVAVKPADVTVQHLRLAAMYEEAGKLIGTEEKSNDLIGRVMEGDGSSKKLLKTISIVGFGGLGKTTLANVVYDKLKIQFDCAAFVTVSQNPNIERIFANMLRQLGHGNHEVTCDTEQLIHELRVFLQDRRYLIVIDDIWKTSVWEVIKYALIGNECGSIIISTTRNLDVANEIGGVYQLQPLSTIDSTRLFKIRIYGTEDECIPNELTEVSRDILRKCGGVPLAIITIASMLASKEGMVKSYQYWSKVCKTLGSGLKDSPDVEKMRRIISVSYYELPPHLKNCMLYLSSYPEDHGIQKKELIKKWIGEGFVIEEQGKSFDEVAEDYVNELINRSMIQPYNKYMFRIHDMILDLITRLANEQGFLAAVDDQLPNYRQERMHRLSLIRASSEEDVKKLSTLNLHHVRSLIHVTREAFNLLPPLSTFPVLRVLILSGCWQVDNSCLKNICNLFHLRHLDLSRTCITEIPKEIQNLQLLRVLDISCTDVHELPSTFGSLRNLVCMEAKILYGVPAGFKNLRSLQQLEGTAIFMSPIVLTNFTGLSELRNAKLFFLEWDEGYVKPFIQCLSSLVSLEYLEISGSGYALISPYDRLIMPGPQQLQSIVIRNNTLQAVPEWMSTLSGLTSLHISTLLTLGGEGLHVLGSMPSLRDLHINLDTHTEGMDRELVISKDCLFLSLRSFQIGFITRVVFAQGVMPKVERLELEFGTVEIIYQLGELVVGVENLPSLVDIYISLDILEYYPEKSKAAKDKIRNAVAISKNKPSLHIEPMDYVLKICHHCEKWDEIEENIFKITGVTDVVTDPDQQGKITVHVSSFSNPITFVEEVEKNVGLVVELLDYY